MADGTSDTAFDDADQLDKTIKDARSLDKLRNSKIANARSLIADFANDTSNGAWPNLDRSSVVNRLLDLIGPESSDAAGEPDEAGRAVQQGALNLCGPAAFFQFVIKRDPVMFAKYATSLFNTGKGDLGDLHVEPSSDIINTNYADLIPRMARAVCPQADWMVLGALRNSTNAFWTGSFKGTPDEVVAAGTRPSELADWMQKTGLYSSVSNEANWLETKGIPHATGLPEYDGVDVAALINADLIRAARNLPSDSSWPLTEFPNHWVIIIGKTMPELTKDAVYFSIWTWGGTLTLDVPTKSFVDNYYGTVIGKLDKTKNQTTS
jgi:hypothetical protein